MAPCSSISRGRIVDVDALHAPALVSGHLGGAAIDVFPEGSHANGIPGHLRQRPSLSAGPLRKARYDIGRFVACGEYQSQQLNRHDVNLPNPGDEHRQALAHRTLHLCARRHGTHVSSSPPPGIIA